MTMSKHSVLLTSYFVCSFTLHRLLQAFNLLFCMLFVLGSYTCRTAGKSRWYYWPNSLHRQPVSHQLL